MSRKLSCDEETSESFFVREVQRPWEYDKSVMLQHPGIGPLSAKEQGCHQTTTYSEAAANDDDQH